MEITVNAGSAAFFEALGSETRLKIVALLAEQPMDIGEMAESLGVSSAIVTRHIDTLQKAGIVTAEKTAGRRGRRRLCRLREDTALLRFRPAAGEEGVMRASVPVGHYSAWQVRPTCGLARPEGIIGAVDDPRYFADPAHVGASLLWFGGGYVEYRLPNFLLRGQSARAIQLSFEICSEAPGVNENWPSDIAFSLNGVRLGTWTSPGDFGGRRGRLTPLWWDGTQYGLLKTLRVDASGSYIDGIRLSDVTIARLGLDFGREIVFRVANPPEAAHRGGVTLFGRGFGNYDQNIELRLFADPPASVQL